MASLGDFNARLASVWTGITHIKIDVDKIYTYLDLLLTHNIPSVTSSSTFREIEKT